MNKYLPRVRLYPEQDEDRQILSWLGVLPDRAKSPAIKKALLRGINPPSNGSANQATTFDVDALRRTFLPDIRRVIDAALQEVTSFAPKPTHLDTYPAEEEQKISQMLDSLELSFMLEEEEDA